MAHTAGRYTAGKAKGADNVRGSGWLFLAQQTLGGLALLLALGQRLQLRPRPLRLLAASCAAAAACLAGGAGPLRLAAWALTGLLPLAAFPHLPRAMRGGAYGTALLFTLAAEGLCRLFAGLGLPAGAAALSPLLLPGLLLLMGRGPRPSCGQVRLRRMGREVTLTAMVDSGNLLRDPITGLPVIVCARRAVAPLLPPGAAEGLAPGMRLISVRTVAGTSLMAVFRPQEALVRGAGPWRPVKALVGVAPQGYSGCQALVPACLAEASCRAPAVAQQG